MSRQEELFIMLCLKLNTDFFCLKRLYNCHALSLFQFQKKINTTYIIPYPRPAIVTQPVDIHYNFCKLKPLSPEETLEEQLLLESIAWPETPSLPSPLFMNSSSDPAHSTFTILPRKREGQWQIGDNLEALIKIYDFMGRPKKYGGDVLLAQLHNPTLGAGVAGQVVDHLNGSYSAVFSLLWEGSAQVEVMIKLLIFIVTGVVAGVTKGLSMYL